MYTTPGLSILSVSAAVTRPRYDVAVMYESALGEDWLRLQDGQIGPWMFVLMPRGTE